MIYLHYKDTKTFGHSFSFLLIFKTLRASYLQVGNFSEFIDKLYVKEPERAYQLLGAVYHRLVQTRWRGCSRERYEYVAGHVCLYNFHYNEAFQHAMVLQRMGETVRELQRS